MLRRAQSCRLRSVRRAPEGLSRSCVMGTREPHRKRDPHTTCAAADRNGITFSCCQSLSDCVLYRATQLRSKTMPDVAEKMARLGRLRNAALVAVVIPAALLAGCAAPAPPPP